MKKIIINIIIIFLITMPCLAINQETFQISGNIPNVDQHYGNIKPLLAQEIRTVQVVPFSLKPRQSLILKRAKYFLNIYSCLLTVNNKWFSKTNFGNETVNKIIYTNRYKKEVTTCLTISVYNTFEKEKAQPAGGWWLEVQLQ